MANPFASDDNDNPFAYSDDAMSDHGGRSGSSDNVSNPFGSGDSSSADVVDRRGVSRTSRPSTRGRDLKNLTDRELRTKEEELRALEEELELRERGIAAREAALPGLRIPNWPRCKPIIHHDIEKDVPSPARGAVRMAYLGWYVFSFTLFFNWISLFVVIVENFDGGGNKGLAFGLASIIGVIGAPLSFALWYRPLYNGVRSDKSSPFVIFFCIHSLHLLMCLFFSIGVPSTGGAGLIIGLQAFGKDSVASGAFCIVCAVVWICNVIWSAVLIKRVHNYYISRGMSLEKARKESAAAAATSV